MEPIDVAYERFQALVVEVSEYINSVVTEADTRLKVIDRIFVGVLHWPHESLMTEKNAVGGFADYACYVGERLRLVLEAKRDGRSLGCEGRPPGAAFKLSGSVFKADSAQEGIKQAVAYCGSLNAELACVTNGREWVHLVFAEH